MSKVNWLRCRKGYMRTLIGLVVIFAIAGCGGSGNPSPPVPKPLASKWSSNNLQPGYEMTADLDLTVSPGMVAFTGATGMTCDCVVTLDDSVTPHAATTGACTQRAGTPGTCSPTLGAFSDFTYTYSGASIVMTQTVSHFVYLFY